MVKEDPPHAPLFAAHCFKTSCILTEAKVELTKATGTRCRTVTADSRPNVLADRSQHASAYMFKQGVGTAAEAYIVSQVFTHLREELVGPQGRCKVPAAPCPSSFFFLTCSATAAR